MGDSMKQTTQPDAISIIVPTLNEAGNMALLMRRIHQPLAAAHIPHEILIVDDHSTDDTIKLAHEAPASYCVRVITKAGKPGKSYSLLEGFAAASNDIVAMIDADLQYPPEEIKPMYDRLRTEKADLIITERAYEHLSPLRKLSTTIFNFIFARILFGIKYDTQSGLKMFHKSILKKYTLNPSPWSFDLEFIVRAIENHHIIINHKIPFYERYAEKAKVHLFSDTFEMISASLRLKHNSSIKRTGLSMQSLKRTAAVIGGFMILSSVFTTAQPATASALSISKLSLNEIIKNIKSITGSSTKPSPATNSAANAPTTTNTSSQDMSVVLPATPVTSPITIPSTTTPTTTTSPSSGSSTTTTNTPITTSSSTTTSTYVPSTATTSASASKSTTTGSSPTTKATQATADGTPKPDSFYGTSPLTAIRRVDMERAAGASFGAGLIVSILAIFIYFTQTTHRRIKAKKIPDFEVSR
jgi:hypothetical protein